ncbi:MAG TPA: glycosyltransferase [Chthoniobacteraceae bacterium]|jgi:GT2 family glycosyltransferase|nr:glycosyltransferase [Chthoniobacteraceae bacterium]
MSPAIVAVVATWQRPAEIAALLDSLTRVGPALVGVVVTDNAGDEATRAALDASPLRTHRLVPEKNLGCGGGLALAEEKALEFFAPAITHVWILDDDAVVEPDSLDKLLAALQGSGAGCACSAIVDCEGRLGWFPGLLDRERFAAVKAGTTPTQFIARFGPAPVAFSWCTGVSLLVKREVFDAVGFHRGDYLIRGEDLEFSLRISSYAKGVFVPDSVVRHLPPAVDNIDPAKNYQRHLYMLQNLAYTGFRVAHGRSLLRSFPGNWLRFLREWGPSLRNFRVAFGAFWRGAVLGLPVGADPRTPQ